MGISITLTTHTLKSLRRHLFKGTAEQAAFLFCDQFGASSTLTLTVKDSYVVPHDKFTIHSAIHIELADEVRPAIIKQAWDARRVVVEVHSHRGKGWSAQFSGSDLSGFREFVPHVRWRLRGAPYCALVFTETEFDALCWVGTSGKPIALDALRVENMVLRPTDRTLKALEEEKSEYESI